MVLLQKLKKRKTLTNRFLNFETFNVLKKSVSQRKLYILHVHYSYTLEPSSGWLVIEELEPEPAGAARFMDGSRFLNSKILKKLWLFSFFISLEKCWFIGKKSYFMQFFYEI